MIIKLVKPSTVSVPDMQAPSTHAVVTAIHEVIKAWEKLLINLQKSNYELSSMNKVSCLATYNLFP